MTRSNLERNYLTANQSFTLFIPSNNAMKNMKPSTLKNLNKNERAVEFLLDHIVIGKFEVRELMNDMELRTLSNKSIRINKKDGIRVCIFN